MPINLGENPLILIFLTLLETLLILIPSLIASKIEKKSFRNILNDIGFKPLENHFKDVVREIVYGIIIGALLFIVGGFILLFFRDIIVRNLFGTKFTQQGMEGSINTELTQPNLLYLIIFIILQIIIVGPCEEGFFRGFIFKKLNNQLKLVLALIISSSLFALYHTPPIIVPLTTIITYFGYFFTFGCFLVLIFNWFKMSLIPCSVAHSIFNILILII